MKRSELVNGIMMSVSAYQERQRLAAAGRGEGSGAASLFVYPIMAMF